MVKAILVFFMMWIQLAIIIKVFNVLSNKERFTVAKVLFRSGVLAVVSLSILSLIVVLF